MQNDQQAGGIGFQIDGPYDIAVMRQHIRELSQALDWSSVLRLRSIAAFTALAEMAHFKDLQRQGPLVVYVQVLDEPGNPGVEFHIDTDFEAISKKYPIARWQLAYVSDDFDIAKGENSDHVVVRVWENRRSL